LSILISRFRISSIKRAEHYIIDMNRPQDGRDLTIHTNNKFKIGLYDFFESYYDMYIALQPNVFRGEITIIA